MMLRTAKSYVIPEVLAEMAILIAASGRRGKARTCCLQRQGDRITVVGSGCS